MVTTQRTIATATLWTTNMDLTGYQWRRPAALSPLFGRPHDARDGAHHLVPRRLLFGELPLSGRREPVILGAPVGLRLPPFGGEPSLLFQPVQRGIERAVLDLQRII